MSCRRRSHTTPGYLQPRTLDDRIRDDYRYNYRGSRNSRRYQPNYDDFYARPPSVYQPVEPYYPRPRESYYVRPPSVYQPTETLYPGPMPNSYQRHSYAQPVSYQPVYPSYREMPVIQKNLHFENAEALYDNYHISFRDVYAPSTYSSYPRRRSMSNNPLIDPE
ncbi:unnamed protein product [Schistosoma margrebowiei]|uniref:Uncharacterized protein n=1 Tax=Schistosoma margrebowiei TaxID=48269 RepID=A0A183LZ58_9TREM|nr:unnamed protein product [Schistosoma margrebowiei]